MDFLKRNLFFIVCILVAVAGIGLGVTGLQAMPKVTAEMEEAQRLYQSLNSQQAKPANQSSLDAQHDRIAQINEDRSEILTKVKSLYTWEPLLPGALPNGDAFSRTEFARSYRAKMASLAETLRAGQPATQFDVTQQEDAVKNELATLERPTGPATTAAGVKTLEGTKFDPVARASIAAARQINCYFRPYDFSTAAKQTKAAGSFDHVERLMDPRITTPPDGWDIWWAQLKLWIQEDAVNAIAAVNEDAARQREEAPWVGVMPVKEVVSIRVCDEFILPDTVGRVADPKGDEPALPPCGVTQTSFTGAVSNDLYEVTQFTLKLVMDERDIPKLIEKLSANSFHTLIRMTYLAEPVNRTMNGKIYGAEPVVRVVMDWETILLGDVFRPLMPDSILESYALPIPEDRVGEAAP